MDRNKNASLCPVCGGRKEPGATTHSVELGTGVIVTRNVRAKICTQCGEEWIDNKTAQRLERIVDEARKKNPQVEVVAF